MALARQKESLKAPFLVVALPRMDDPFFVQKVVLVVEYSAEKGAKGFCLNNCFPFPLNASQEESAEKVESNRLHLELKDFSGKTIVTVEEDILCGGPADTERLFALHGKLPLKTQKSVKIDSKSRFFYSTHADTFTELMNYRNKNKSQLEKPFFLRYFIGQCLWKPGQLEDEIHSGVWLICPFEEELMTEKIGQDQAKWSRDFWRRSSLLAGADPLIMMGMPVQQSPVLN